MPSNKSYSPPFKKTTFVSVQWRKVQLIFQFKILRDHVTSQFHLKLKVHLFFTFVQKCNSRIHIRLLTCIYSRNISAVKHEIEMNIYFCRKPGIGEDGESQAFDDQAFYDTIEESADKIWIHTNDISGKVTALCFLFQCVKNNVK